MKKQKNKLVKTNYVLFADHAFVLTGGKLGIVGIFDILGVMKFPTSHPKMFIVANIIGEARSAHDVKINMFDPDGIDLLAPNGPNFKVQLSGTGSGNILQEMVGLAFNKQGEHTAVLSVDGKDTYKSVLTVVKTKSSDNLRRGDDRGSVEKN